MRWLTRLSRLLRHDSPSLLVIGRLGAAGLGLISAPIVARSIGPDGRGQTAAAIALFYLVPILLSIGIPLEVRRISALSDGKSGLRASRLLSVAALPATSLLAIALGSTLFSGFDTASQRMAVIGVALSPMMMSWSCDVSMLVAHGRYRAVMFMQIAQPGIYVLIIGGLWIMGLATTATVLAASIVGTGTTFLVGLWLTKTSVRGEYYSLTLLLKGGLRFAGSSIAGAASSRLDQVLVLPLIGAFQSGIYSVGVTVASIPLSLGQALGASYFTPIARADESSRLKLQAAATRSALAMAAMSFPPMCIAIIVGVPVLFGNDFLEAVPVAMICLIGTMAMLCAHVCSMALAAVGRGIIMSIAQFISLGVAVTLLYVLGPTLGSIGAAIASSLSYVLLLVTLIIAIGVPASSLIPRRVDFAASIKRLMKDQ